MMMDGKTVYIVEDDQLVADLLRNALQNLHFKVKTFRSGEEMVNALDDHKADLIILDYFLPGGKNGFETLKLIREHDELVSVILFSAIQNEDVLKDLRQFNLYQFVFKAPGGIGRVVNVIKGLYAQAA